MCPGVHKNRNLRRDVPIKLSFAQEPRNECFEYLPTQTLFTLYCIFFFSCVKQLHRPWSLVRDLLGW